MGPNEKLAIEVGRLVDDKSRNYGDSVGKTEDLLRLYCKKGIRPDQYVDVQFIMRIGDKFSRVMTQPDAYGEDPVKDIVGYALRWLEIRERRRAAKEPSIADGIEGFEPHRYCAECPSEPEDEGTEPARTEPIRLTVCMRPTCTNLTSRADEVCDDCRKAERS